MRSGTLGDVRRVCALIAGGYAIVGVSWILLSDWVVSLIDGSHSWFVLAQKYKGVGFVLLTSWLLYLILVRVYTRLMKIEREGKESELKVIDLFERHPTPMKVYDAQTLQVLAINEAAEHKYGYSEQEVLGKSCLLFTHPDERERRGLTLGMHRGGGFERDGRWRHITRAGEVVHVQVSSTRIKYAGRDAILAMATDITSDVSAQEALLQQEARFMQLHDSLSDVLWLLDADRKSLLYISPSCRRLYGREPEEFLGNNNLWLEVIHPEDRPVASLGSTEMLTKGLSRCEYRILRPDGTERWVLDRKQHILNEDGSIAMYGGILQDVTEARSARQQMAELNETLERRVAERTSELVEVNAGLESFSRTVAHDLKSPLNGIIGLAEMLMRSRSDDPELSRLLGLMAKSGRSMTALVDDLLALSRVNLTEIERVDVDISAMARKITDELAMSEPGRKVELRIAEGLRASADEGLVSSLMQNLIGNAWKYTSKKDAALIEVGRAMDGTSEPVFYVRDNGAGFPIDRAARLFEPFQRFHSSKEFSGTGIGLATCQKVARRHGGDIWAASTLGVGSTFYFTLSRSSADAHARHERSYMQA